MPGFEFPRANGSAIAARPNRLRITLFALLALVLVWQILSRSLVAYLAPAAPEDALFLRSGDPVALVSVADRELNFTDKDKTTTAGQSGAASKPLGQLRNRVETALAADPLNARAYRLLGQLAEREQANPRAAKLMLAATRHSLHESIAVDWMMRKSFENKDYPATAFYADALLRTYPPFMEFALPILGRMAENKDAKGEIEKLLAANPPWRSRFFSALGGAITDARTPLDLFLSLKDTAAPPTAADLGDYLYFLIQHKLYELAYYTWLQFLPVEQLESTGFLFNGSFETKPSGLLFDWAMPPGVGLTLDIAPRPEATDKHALFLEFGQGRVDFPGVSQTVMLPPGAYRFNGSFKGEVVGRRGLQWSISCMGGAAIGASQMFLGAFPAWRDFEFAFTVPESGCRAQAARLVLAARSASEQLVSGSIWFDELSISRQQPNSTQ
jgi:hypothetical protein